MTAGRAPGTTLRVLTWNVHGLRAGADAVAGVLRDAGCDVALLQEGPRGPRTLPRAADLARRAGMLVGAAGRPAAGAVVLVAARLDVLAAAATELPVRGLRMPVRGSATALVAPPGGAPVVVSSAHLGLSEDERADHVRRLQPLPDDVVGRAPGAVPRVVGVDLNERPGGPSWSTLLPDAEDCWAVAGRDGDGATYPAARPRQRIDALLVRGARVLATTVPAVDGASDHRPVVADLAVGDPVRA
ncbi:endonuclease/exonuclease/phosphatase family protein [Pseudokineococcus lusitanus]|uniref:Endonuclease/exonuclease/phosphatase family metal-dependent hydrolase n=1 Tax=Pseudokineococcus lusitanus TaxID=763993 RepID=A0A3N1HT73_9ACTN|nr:endonuclease/exonuclease/phosphatase family protein [Pseudokineococcus lusitanus]ROP45701.1 endonuclease/exonuclease/phosphatase family metal-dependent hydrolase [Pseudokineococcus lusitanus]